MAYTPLTASDIAKAQVFTAGITKIEIKDEDGNSSLYFEISPLESPELRIEAVNQQDVRKRNFMLGANVLLTGNALVTGTNIFTFMSEIPANMHDVKLTDINGHTFTFTADQFQMSASFVNGGNTENSRMLEVDGSGYVTATELASVFATT